MRRVKMICPRCAREILKLTTSKRGTEYFICGKCGYWVYKFNKEAWDKVKEMII